MFLLSLESNLRTETTAGLLRFKLPDGSYSPPCVYVRLKHGDHHEILALDVTASNAAIVADFAEQLMQAVSLVREELDRREGEKRESLTQEKEGGNS